MWKWSKEDCQNCLSITDALPTQRTAAACHRVLKQTSNQGSLESRMR